MKYLGAALAALALTSSTALAGGIDRSALTYAILFEDGRVGQLSFSNVNPTVSGAYAAPFSAFGASTKDMAQSYTTLSFGFKADITDKLAYAIMANTPYGADSKYSGGLYAGLEAHWSSRQVAALLKYQFTDRISAYGGVRYVTSQANIIIPPALLGGVTYTATAASDSKLGYVIGAAYEIPAIALRAGLTYESAINHQFATAERFNGGPAINSTTKITLPQSVAFDFQTGIAKDTLLFGSVKWSEWSKWQVKPLAYSGLPAPAGGRITGFDHNVTAYQLGIGRKINDSVSVFARLGYEQANGGVVSRLSPTDGMQSIGIGGSWSHDKMKLTGGVEYVKLGNAVDSLGTQFTGNHALGLGLSVAFNF